MSIEVRSAAFNDGERIPARFTKAGDDVSPPLEWSGVPDEARELVIVVEDPDAPTGTFVHWHVAGILPGTTSVELGQPPAGAIEGRNDFGDVGYGGPLPPEGDPPHRYVFMVAALKEPSGLSRGVGPLAFNDAVQTKIFASGQLIGVFDDPSGAAAR